VLAESFADQSDRSLRRLARSDRLPATDVSTTLLREHLAAPGAETALDAVLRTDVHLLMPDDPVKRIDSMLMASGVEARVPFLDHELVQLVAACPPELKAADRGKGVLKALGRWMLPAEVVDRPKGYFPVPQFRHLSGPVLERVGEVLRAPEARARGLFDEAAIERMLAHPNAETTPVGGNPLWNLAVLELWLQHHVDGAGAGTRAVGGADAGAQREWGSSRTTRIVSTDGSAASGMTIPAATPVVR
jgi:asparagine synthase (glutamine-hydrolysing)